MPLGTNIKTLRSMADFLLAEVASPFPVSAQPKPVMPTAAHSVPLPRSTPEREGLSSLFLEEIYRDIAAGPLTGAHALLVARHGRVVSEGYFAPYRSGIWHVSHSLCKSFTGTAVGIALGEGLFKLDDFVADYFPELVTRFTGRRTRQVTVRHVLTMTSGFIFSEISQAMDNDWLRGIFTAGVAFEPGSRFLYNSLNSYLLSALVQRTSGQTVLEYLTPRVLEPMGFGPVAFEKSPEGIDKGGWGMYLTVEDMLKFGQLYLQKGSWQVEGKARQLVPASYIEEATQVQVRGENGEHYGYHLWIDNAEGAFIMNGMFGQYITVLPHQDMVLAMTSGNPYIFTDSPAHNIFRSKIYPLHGLPDTLPENPAALASLRGVTAGLRYRRPVPPARRVLRPAPPRSQAARWQAIRREACPALHPELTAFCGTTWRFNANRGGILPVVLQVMNNNFSSGVQAVRLEAEPSGLFLYWEEAEGTVCIPLGLQKPQEHIISMGGERFIVAGSCELRHNEDNEAVLMVEICLLEHSSSRLLKLRLLDKGLELRMDEQPGLLVAIETVLEQNAKMGGTGRVEQLGNSLLHQGYLEHKVQKVCCPVIVGEPVQE